MCRGRWVGGFSDPHNTDPPPVHRANLSTAKQFIRNAPAPVSCQTHSKGQHSWLGHPLADYRRLRPPERHHAADCGSRGAPSQSPSALCSATPVASAEMCKFPKFPKFPCRNLPKDASWVLILEYCRGRGCRGSCRLGSRFGVLLL